MQQVTDFINGKVTYSKEGQYLWVTGQKGKRFYMLAQIRGWSQLLKFYKTGGEAIKIQDEVGKFIADAINEKIERLKM